MATLGTKLKIARNNANLLQSDVSKLLNEKYEINVARETISRWESDVRVPKQEILCKLAEIYNVPIEYLCDDTPKIIAKDILSSTPQFREDTTLLPILGTVAAGNGAYADNAIDGYEYAPSSWVHDGTEVFLKVKGDSMYPKFEENDLLLIHPQENIENGEYGVVLIDGNDGVVKRVMINKDSIELISINPLYPPRIFKQEDMSRLRIFGKVKKLIRNY